MRARWPPAWVSSLGRGHTTWAPRDRFPGREVPVFTLDARFRGQANQVSVAGGSAAHIQGPLPRLGAKASGRPLFMQPSGSRSAGSQASALRTPQPRAARGAALPLATLVKGPPWSCARESPSLWASPTWVGWRVALPGRNKGSGCRHSRGTGGPTREPPGDCRD